MLNKLIRTQRDWAMFVTRVGLGAVMLPHGLQKVFGWFGGHGFANTLNGFQQNFGTPKPVTTLVVLAESVGALALILGFAGRFMAFSIALTMVGAIAMVHAKAGFFMNWGAAAGKYEGFEYHILAIAMAVAVMIRGSGAASVDLALQRGRRD
jgi:putative oxidoreductase